VEWAPPPFRLLFVEDEATTVLLAADEAAARGSEGTFPCQWIVLGASSDLGAVGLLAAITGELARAGIALNAISAFHHDHLFVPAGRGAEAVELLRRLQARHEGT